MIGRLRAAAKRLWFWLRRKRGEPARPAAPGRWVYGSQSVWFGRMVYAPWVRGERDYQLYIPAGYRVDGHYPLVVMLHGCRQDADSFAGATRINRLADEQGFLALYPRQRRDGNPYQCWNWFDPASQRGFGEAAIIAAMVKTIRQAYAIDGSRVYIVGLSAGGAMAANLALGRHARLFAAVAVHSGLPRGAARTPWAALRAMRDGAPRGLLVPVVRWPWRPIPRAVVFHGAADTVVNPVNAERLVEQWAAGYGGPAALRVATSTESADAAGAGYACTTTTYYQGERAVLQYHAIATLGHAWSGGDPAYPYSDPVGPDASRLLWAFFTGQDESPEL